MVGLPLDKPAPDFETFAAVLKGEKEPEKVHFVELGVDAEVMQDITEKVFEHKWVPLTEETREVHEKQYVDFYYRMGYDFAKFPGICNFTNMPQFKERTTADSAGLSRGQRSWVEEGGGIIKNWQDFEQINWDKITPELSALEYLAKHLPQGMKITCGTTLFEMILERFLGYEDLFMLSVDSPELVEAVFAQWGQKVYECYKQVVQHPEVGVVFHMDDLGYKTGTMMSPEFLRKNVFPWLKKYAALAHEQGKMFWHHCCGNVAEVMEDLIEDVKLDGFHSFQDVIIPVGDFVQKYGGRVAALGGIDMDKLARMEEQELRQYVRETLAACMPGRYALGSGNTIANYIPPEHYLAMLDEGLKWAG